MGCSERQKEIKRRRIRKQKVAWIKKKAEKASAGEKENLAAKLRNLTPGATELIARFKLDK